jgi:hypothetical protein
LSIRACRKSSLTGSTSKQTMSPSHLSRSRAAGGCAADEPVRRAVGDGVRGVLHAVSPGRATQNAIESASTERPWSSTRGEVKRIRPRLAAAR